MSHATLLETLETGALWSVARGLARRVETYKELLANCDRGGRNDLDGRGPLSEEALVAFTRFFLETCLDQITFMENLVQPEALRHRILGWAEGQVRLKALPANTGKLLEAVLYRGELPRAEVGDVLHVGVRQGQRIVAELVKANVLVSDDSRAPLRIRVSSHFGIAVDARLISRKAVGMEEQLGKLFPYVTRRASLLVIFDVLLRMSLTDNNFGFSWWYNCALP
jgi:hypothetical protein